MKKKHEKKRERSISKRKGLYSITKAKQKHEKKEDNHDNKV